MRELRTIVWAPGSLTWIQRPRRERWWWLTFSQRQKHYCDYAPRHRLNFWELSPEHTSLMLWDVSSISELLKHIPWVRDVFAKREEEKIWHCKNFGSVRLQMTMVKSFLPPFNFYILLLFLCLCSHPLSFLAFWKYKILPKLKYTYNSYIKIGLWLCLGCRPYCVQLTLHYMLMHSALKSLVGAEQNKQSEILAT